MSAGELWERVGTLFRNAVKAGRFQNLEEALAAAGLSRGYLDQQAFQLREGKTPTMTLDTAHAISRALGIRVIEIVAPEELERADIVDIFPERAAAVSAARSLRYPEAAIQAVLAEKPSVDYPKITWFRKIEAEAERLRPTSDR